MVKSFIKTLDRLYPSFEGFLLMSSKSKILQNHVFNLFESFVYSTIINNFFNNLNEGNFKEYKLPQGKITELKHVFKEEQKSIKLALSLNLKKGVINKKYYSKFKLKLRKNYPAFLRLLKEVESVFKIERIENYLAKKETQIKKVEKYKSDLNAFFNRIILENYVKQRKKFPTIKELKLLNKALYKKIIPQYSKV